MQLVDAALRALREQPLMVLAFARPEVDEQFPDLWGERDLQRVTLRALTRKACQNLAQQVLGDGLAPAIQDWLVERADGNPFYLEELIRAVAAGARSALPETVVGMVQARLDALGSDASACCAPRASSARLRRDGISALLSDRDLPALDAALEALVAREVILPEGHARTSYVVPPRAAARRRLRDAHRGRPRPRPPAGGRVAGEAPASATRWCWSSTSSAAAIGSGRRAGAARPPTRRWRATICRARSRARGGAWRWARPARCAPGCASCEAQAHFWRGEYAHGRGDRLGRRRLRSRGRRALVRCVGELTAALGQQGRYDEVAHLGGDRRAGRPASGATEAQVACLLRAAGYLLRAGDDVTTEAILARVDATVRDVARLEPGLARALPGGAGDAAAAPRRPRGRDRPLQAALASASRTGDTGTMCDMRVNLASVWADLGQLDTAEALLRQTLEQAQTIELHYITTAALINLAPVLTHSGRLGEARRLAMQALNFARKQGDQRGEGAAQLYLSTISYVAGEHPGSEQRARRAAEIGSPSLRASALAAVARALLAQARRPEALEQARAAAAELAARAANGRAERYESLVHLVLAEALAAAGDIGRRARRGPGGRGAPAGARGAAGQPRMAPELPDQAPRQRADPGARAGVGRG